MNVGASKPSDAGLYFQWGDTVGYTKDQVGKDKQFNWSDYKWSKNGSSSNFSKYTTSGVTLDLEDDAAHVHMGGDWHIPTNEQIQELISTANTENTWTTQNGVNGRLFTSKNNGKSIFIPAAGIAVGGSIESNGRYGDVWSSTKSGGVHHGKALKFYSDNVWLDVFNRCLGLSVRGVIDGHPRVELN